MPLDQNVNPYYNDYDEDNNFHQVLFRPGVSVQARELTQLQTMLQKQTERMGSHIFKEGSVVSGGEQFIESASFIKLTDSVIDVTGYQDYYARSVTNQGLFIIKAVIEAVNTDLDTLYVKSIGSDTGASEFNDALPVADESIKIYATQADMIADINVIATHTVVATIVDAVPTGDSLVAYVTDGVYYSNGNFIRSDAQRTVIEKYTTSGVVSVGFDVGERFITVNDTADAGDTLRDPAAGSYNELAPGADRLKFDLTITTKAVTADVPVYTSDQYIELFRVDAGILVQRYEEANYNVIADELARRTYDESGDYVVSPYDFIINYNNRDENKLDVRVGAGKAYVKGYEVDNIVPTDVTFSKARDTESVAGVDISTYFGNYLYVEGVTGEFFDINGAETVELHSNVTPSGTTKVGDAHVKSIEYVSGTGPTTKLKLFLFNISLSGATTMAAVRSVITGTQGAVLGKMNVHSDSFSSRIILTSYANASTSLTVPLKSNIRIGDKVSGTGIPADAYVTNYVDTIVTINAATSAAGSEGLTFTGTFITDPNNNVSLFRAPNSFIQGTTSVSYKAKKVYSNISVASGVVSDIFTNTPIPGETTERFANATPNTHLHYQMVVKTVTGGVSYSVGEFIDVDQLTITEYTPASTVADQIGFSIDDGGDFIGTVDILVTLDITKDLRKTKTLVSDHNVNLSVIGAANLMSLGVSDTVKSSIVVYQSTDDTGVAAATTSDLDVTANYDIDDGHRNNMYDHATIKLKSGVTLPTAQTLVVCDYYTHTIGKGYFDAGSYPDYDTIPEYTLINTSSALNLRDYLDFRIRRTDQAAGVYTVTYLASFDYQQQVAPSYALADTDYSYYLSRKDIITLDKSGRFGVLAGVSSLSNPAAPYVPDDVMGMFVLTVGPYTYGPKDVQIRPTSVRRYTMRDISSIDDRLSNVEYYTALTAAENEVANTSFADSSGNILFNNGFVVDNFKGHSVGDVYNSDYKCSVDMSEKILHPKIKTAAFNIGRISGGLYAGKDATNTPSVLGSGKFLTLPYTEASFISQKVVSGDVNINPFQVTGFLGYATISPSEDVWVDTVTRPEVVVNDQGEMDAYESALDYEGTEWGGWSAGNTIRSGDYLRTTSRRTSTETYVTSTDYVKSTVSSAQSKTFKYIRERTINFELFRMKPNRPISLLFDGINITHTMEGWTGAGYDSETDIITDANGYAKGRFTIPNNDDYRFLSGLKNVFFTDVILNYGASTTYAQATFLSNGEEITFEKTTVMGIRYEILTRTAGESKSDESYSPVPIPPAPLPPLTVGSNTGDQGTVVPKIQPPPIAPPASVYIDIFATGFTASVTSVNNVISNGGSGAIATFQYRGAMTATPPSPIASTAGHAESIRVLYLTVLNRKPDAGGMNYWLTALASGTITTGELGIKFYNAAQPEIANCQAGDPTAQTFLVSSVISPDGVFTSSIDVFFKTKDAELPVTLELRPVVNGFPSSQKVIPNSRVTLSPSAVVIPADLEVPEATTFTFDNPIHLEPGEYAMVLLTDSSGYRVYVSDVREIELGTGLRIATQPNLGSYFKSQNARTWTADQFKDLMFEIKKCAFDDTTAYSSTYETGVPLGPTTYDSLDITVNAGYLEGTSLDFQIATTPESGSIGAYEYIQPNSTIYRTSRQEHTASSDTSVKVWMSTNNPDVSPYVNLDSFNIITIKNLINNINDPGLSAAPETDNNGAALSKYMTRPVTLSEGFNATSLRVQVLENIQSGTQFEVYYRVLSDEDSERFADKEWVKMTRNGQASNSSSLTEYIDSEYKADTISYTAGSATYSSFNTFAVKIVMYSSNTAFTPTAKNVRVVALS